MPSAVTLASMTAHPQAILAGEQAIVAHLTVECGPLTISGLALTRLPSGEMKIWFPSSGRDRRVVMRDRTERDALLSLAVNAYRALTGRDPAETPVAKASPKSDTFHVQRSHPAR